LGTGAILERQADFPDCAGTPEKEQRPRDHYRRRGPGFSKNLQGANIAEGTLGKYKTSRNN
jgi:hypothetical protein